MLTESMRVVASAGTVRSCVCVRARPYRLVLGVAGAPQQQCDQLRAQDQAVEGQGSEALLHGPLLAGGLVGVQVGVGHVPGERETG